MGTSFHSYPSFEPSIPNASVPKKPKVIMVLVVQDFVFTADQVRKHAQELQQQHSNSTT